MIMVSWEVGVHSMHPTQVNTILFRWLTPNKSKVEATMDYSWRHLELCMRWAVIEAGIVESVTTETSFNLKSFNYLPPNKSLLFVHNII